MWIDNQIIENCGKDLSLICHIPKDTFVVLGRSNIEDKETFLEKTTKDEIPVLKRLGGGGTVVLSNSCIIISVGLWVKDFYKNDTYFRLINKAIIRCLGEEWPDLFAIEQKGISDLVFKQRKIAGSSMFRSRNYLLFQASLLLENSIDKIERYLCHPSREPDYRKQKPHRDFVGFLCELLPGMNKNTVLEKLEEKLERILREELEDDLRSAFTEQMPHLLKKLKQLY